MTQTLWPLYGSPINDSVLTKAVSLPPGVYYGMEPTISGAGGSAGWTAQLGLGSDSISLWRTRGDTGNGNFIIQESAAVQVHIDPPDATNPRIDLIVGLHHWVAGPTNPVTLKPTGEFTSAQQATYAVIKGTPSSSPVEPTVPDPYDVNGNRAVVLASVYVPTSGSATITRYPSTDLRLDYMRLICEDVILSRGGYSTLKSRLDSLLIGTQVQSLAFSGPAPATGSTSTFASLAPTIEKQYGSAVTPRSSTTFGLSQPGLYELSAFYRVDQLDLGNAGLAMKAWLVYNGGSPVLIDSMTDTTQQEYNGELYAQVYVDSTWTDPYIYIERAGWPNGTIRGSVKYLGQPTTLQPLSISSGNLVFSEVGGDTYPTSVTTNLVVANAVGATTWSIVSGASLIDGTTDPKAEIVNGNQLKITFTTRPASLPATFSVKLQVVDSASPARTAQKTITVTLNGVQSLAISNVDFTVNPTSYPYTVSFAPIATGGKPSYTWAVVAGADTTLTGAAWNSGTGTFSGTVSADGTVKIRIRCTDSTTPTANQVEKVINITSALTTVSGGGGSGGPTGCVPAGTLFATVDGLVPVESLQPGMVALAYDDQTMDYISTTISKVFVYEDREMAIVRTDRGDLLCSKDHRLWRQDSRKTRGLDPHWPPVEELLPGDRTLFEVDPGDVVRAVVLDVEFLEDRQTVYHVALERGHVYVAGGFLAHNLKISLD